MNRRVLLNVLTKDGIDINDNDKPLGERTYHLAPGEYMMELIPNPNPGFPHHWWVLTGTNRGMARVWWQRQLECKNITMTDVDTPPVVEDKLDEDPFIGLDELKG